MTEEIDQRVAFAHQLADSAGETIRPYFRQRIEVTDKGAAGFYDPATEADRRAEQAIRELIRTHYPQDGILGEEFGEVPGASGYRWVLDPIDGTRAFIAGQPLWGTLIALEYQGRPVLGLLDQPFLHERFVGTEGQTLFAQAGGISKLRTRACSSL